jgi:hypothetical protein
MIFWAMLACNAQQNVQGLIVNENGKAVAGANILIKGSPNGTVADSLGHFQLTVAPGNNVLYFSFLKHKSLDARISIKPSYHYTVNAVLIRDTGKNRKRESACEIQAIK